VKTVKNLRDRPKPRLPISNSRSAHADHGNLQIAPGRNPPTRGLPCVFRALDRLAICAAPGVVDSEYTFTGGSQAEPWREVATEVERLSPHGGPRRKSPGGEPMLQEREVVPLMQRLSSASYTVLLETSGERPLDKVSRRGHQDCGRKNARTSGEPDTFSYRESGKPCKPHDENQVSSLAPAGDYEFARDFAAKHNLSGPSERRTSSPRPSAKDASGRRDGRALSAQSTRNSPSGCWPTTSMHASDYSSTNSSGTPALKGV